ncbi:MAG: heparinase II/III-family protein [Phycisphaerales bacterium]|nr:heparinase II/III-family protein [Phycisphaerales bacterium]
MPLSLATQVSPAHPHLYFAPSDLAVLRQKISDPQFARDWAAILASAQSVLQETPMPESKSIRSLFELAFHQSAIKGPPMPEGHRTAALATAATNAANCAFAYRITNDPRYAACALAIVEAIFETETWTGEFLGMKGGPLFHLHTAALCKGLAITYDLLASEMSPAERKRFADVCWQKALSAYIAECKPGAGDENVYLSGNRTMNWLAVLSCGAGSLFIALDGDVYDFSREIEITKSHVLRFIEWADDDGSALEHGDYWVYGMSNALELMYALKCNGWPNILHQPSRKLQRSAYPILYGCILGKHVVNFCDDFYGELSARNNALLLAAAFQDPTLQWFADQLPPAGIIGLIAADSNLPAIPPTHLPTCMFFPRTGIGIMRESMTDPNTRLLALKAGRTRGEIYDDPHCQFDLNAVILDAFGQSLFADPGYGHDWTGPISTNDPAHPFNSTPPHNTLLINNRGQEAQYSPLAFLTDLSPTPEIDYLVSRMEQGYGPILKRFDRHAYFIDKRFFVLLDDIELTEPAKLTWNFHGVKGATLTTDPIPTITNQTAKLEILPTTSILLTRSVQTTHVFPRIEWTTQSPTATARIAWLLLPSRTTDRVATPTLQLQPDAILVTDGPKQWHLPIVSRRVPLNSSMTLIQKK